MCPVHSVTHVSGPDRFSVVGRDGLELPTPELKERVYVFRGVRGEFRAQPVADGCEGSGLLRHDLRGLT